MLWLPPDGPAPRGWRGRPSEQAVFQLKSPRESITGKSRCSKHENGRMDRWPRVRRKNPAHIPAGRVGANATAGISARIVGYREPWWASGILMIERPEESIRGFGNGTAGCVFLIRPMMRARHPCGSGTGGDGALIDAHFRCDAGLGNALIAMQLTVASRLLLEVELCLLSLAE